MSSRRQFLAGAAALTAAAPAQTRKGENTIALRTHEWLGDKLEQFPFPPGWRITQYPMNGHAAPALDGAQIRKALDNPIGTKTLREIAAGKKTVAIAVDDMTRPTPTYEVVPFVIADLKAVGIKDENILFVVGHGCHYQMNGMEMAKKIGTEAVSRHPWINHNIWENLADVGVTKGGNHVQINAYYRNADVRITLSGLKRHGTPGYGGGPKLILPGVSGVKTIRYMHNTIRQANRPSRTADGKALFHIYENEQRQDMVEAARLAGVDFSVQMVYNQDRRLVHVTAGDVDRAHLAACRFAVPHKSTPYARNADIIVANAYPKGAQLHEHFGWANAGLKDGGSVVIINQNPMGEFVWHYDDQRVSFENGGPNWFKARDARRKSFRNVGQLLLYSQYVQAREINDPLIPAEAVGVREWAGVLDRLKAAHKGDVEVAVYPCAGIQHEVATHDIPDNA
jgi:nickel-dependent lactate racemase